MSTKLRIAIETQDGKNRFSNDSHIRGTVYLSVPSATTLESIAVKLEGVARSLVDVGERSTNRRERKRATQGIHTDTHVFLYRSMIVFPPPQVRQVLSAKSFTLTPGDYEYPFEFILPNDTLCSAQSGISNKVEYTQGRVLFHKGNLGLRGFALRELSLALIPPSPRNSVPEESYHVNTSLPPSFEVGPLAKITYFVKATAKRASVFKVNLRSIDPFIYVPRQELSGIEGWVVARSQDIVGHGYSKGLQAHFEVRLPDPVHVNVGRTPTFRLFMVALSGKRGMPAQPVYMQSLCLSMITTTTVLVKVVEPGSDEELSERQLHETSSEIATRQFNNLKFDYSQGQNALEVPLNYYENFVIPKRTVPSFKICNIERKYSLLFTIGISLEKMLNPSDRSEAHKKLQYVTVDCPDVRMMSAPSRIDRVESVPPYAGGGSGYPTEKESAPHYNQDPVPLPPSPSPISMPAPILSDDNPPVYSEVNQ